MKKWSERGEWKSDLYSVNWKGTQYTYYCRSISKDHGWILIKEVDIRGSLTRRADKLQSSKFKIQL